MDDPAEIQRIVLDQFEGATFRFAPQSLVKKIRDQYPDIHRAQVQAAITHLVQEGFLLYSHRFSSTQLERNFQGCLSVSSRISLCSIHDEPAPSQSDIIIRLFGGDAFGLGDHPTTCLALRGVEIAMEVLSRRTEIADLQVLDIGTGSGVLAFAAAKLGAGQVQAIDHDAIARHEAKINTVFNGLETRVHISAMSLEEMQANTYSLIMANLRPPTLFELFYQMARLSRSPGLWVLSGFRHSEEHSIVKFFEKAGATIFWHQKENTWSALIVELNKQALKGILTGIKKRNL